MKKTSKYFFLAFVLILITQTNVFACSCTDEPNFDEMFEASNAVIKGGVVIVENFKMEVFALIKVEKSWKGIDEDKVIIKTDTGSCGIEFEVGETYYLWVDKLDKNYITMPCRNYGEKQIDFLKDKPTLLLKSSNLDADENFNSKNDSSNAGQKKDSESSNNGTKKKSPKESSDLTLIFAVSVTATVFMVLAIIIGFFFWRNRKR